MRSRTAKQERLASVPLFRGCTVDQLRQVERLADEVSVPAGRKVIRQGAAGYEFCVIESGTATVLRDGAEVATLGPGDHFGELALLGAPRRNADVVAATDLEVIVLGSREFSTLLDTVPMLSLTLLRVLATRLSDLDSRIH